MEANDLLKSIDEYLDGELEKSREPGLFISLSNNETARNHFKQQYLLKSVVGKMQEEFPEDLEKRILSRTTLNGKNKFFAQRMKLVVSYAAIIVLLCVSLFFYLKTNSYKKDIARINYNLEEQNKTIESILNSLPAAEVRGTKQDQIIVKATKL